MSALDIERIRVCLEALTDGSRQVGEIRVRDPKTGRKTFAGDLSRELLADIDDEVEARRAS